MGLFIFLDIYSKIKNMIFGFNIQLFVTVLLFPFIYSLIIFFTSPYKSVSYKRGLLFLLAGIFSTEVVHLIYFFIPYLGESHSDFFTYFGIVGPVEEVSKFIMFYGMMSLTKDKKVSEHPFKYMFYFGMTGLGFALLENIHYIMYYGEEILLPRSFTSTIAHMIFGLLFGYYIGLGSITRKSFENRSIFGVLVRKNKKIKKFIYFLTGYLLASYYHGMYNYNLATSDESAGIILMILLAFGLIICKLLADDLNRKWSLREKKSKID